MNENKVAKLHALGLTDPQIGKKLGMSTCAVRWIRKQKLKLPGIKAKQFMVAKIPQAIKNKVRMLHRRGMSDNKIASELGMSKSAARLIRHKMGLPVNVRVNVSDSDIVRLHGQLKSDIEIAKIFKCGSNTIGAIRRKLGLPVYYDAAIPKFEKLYSQGMTDIGIANATGLSRDLVSAWRRKSGLPSRKFVDKGVVVYMLSTGLLPAEIAKKIGKSKTAITNIQRNMLANAGLDK